MRHSVLKPQVSVMVTYGVSVVDVAGWPVILTGWPVTGDGGCGQPAAADAERYRCACLRCTPGLAGRGDGYQCGLLDWGRSMCDADGACGVLRCAVDRDWQVCFSCWTSSRHHTTPPPFTRRRHHCPPPRCPSNRCRAATAPTTSNSCDISPRRSYSTSTHKVC